LFEYFKGHFFVFAYIQHYRNGSEGAENSGGPPRIADIDVNAVGFGNFNIITPDINITVQNRTQNPVGAFQGFGAVFGGNNLCPVITRFDYLINSAGNVIQAGFINIH